MLRLVAVVSLASIAVGCGGAPAVDSRPEATPPEAASPAQPAITGVVQAPDGAPVGDALVCVYDLSKYKVAGWVRAGADGRFSVPAAPGPYVVSATAAGFAGAMSDGFAHGESDSERTPTLAGELELAMAPARSGGTLRGQFSLPAQHTDELPVVLLHAARGNWLEPFCAEPDQRGAFEAILPEGRYVLDVNSPDKRWLVDFIRYEVRREAVTLATQPLFRFADLTEPATPQVIDELRQLAIPLRSAEVGGGHADLAGLDHLVRDARVVALGEATHGTREFFQIKHRMLEYLVEKHGFDLFAIEAIFSESLAVNDYVLHGKGTAAEALAGMYFWVWDTEEVLALIEWMRAYNADPAHSRKVRFYGFDMQFTPAASRAVRAYLATVGSPLAEQLAPMWQAMAEEDWNASYVGSKPEQAAKVRENLAAVVAAMAENRTAWVAETGERSFELARQHLRILEQAEAQFRPEDAAEWAARDRAMAANTLWLLEHEPPGTRIVLWAHNRHIQESTRGLHMMGAHLAEALGEQYVSFGFAFNQGAFQARDRTLSEPMGVTEVTVPPEPVGSVGHTLARVGHPIFAIDLRAAARAPALGAWLSKPRLQRDLGGAFTGDKEVTYPFRHAEDFDALFFVETTTRARPTETGKRGPGE